MSSLEYILFNSESTKHFHIINSLATDIKIRIVCCCFYWISSLENALCTLHSISKFKLASSKVFNRHMWLGSQSQNGFSRQQTSSNIAFDPHILRWYILRSETQLSFCKSFAQRLHNESLKTLIATRKCDLERREQGQQQQCEICHRLQFQW